MSYQCLIVDLSKDHKTQSDHALGAEIDSLQLKPIVVTSAAEAVEKLKTERCALLCIGLDAVENTAEIQQVLKTFQERVGSFADFQFFVSDDISPELMTLGFEYGIEQFSLWDDWKSLLARIDKDVHATLSDPESAESKTLRLVDSIHAADQGKIREAQESMDDLASYDYRVAYSSGVAFEATGDLPKAIESFETASKLNTTHRPAQLGLGNALMVNGDVDRAVKIFEKMEKSNPNDVYRKSHLASAYMMKGDTEKAKELLGEAEALGADHPKVKEAKAQLLLAEGKVEESVALLDQLQDVGPLLASSLNELGVRLSRAGKGKSSLSLYAKAHRIVRADLRYKISMNAALACRRMKAFDKALEYLDRCQDEYGSRFEKLEKIRLSVLKDIKDHKQAG